jgi:hypothetical protein
MIAQGESTKALKEYEPKTVGATNVMFVVMVAPAAKALRVTLLSPTMPQNTVAGASRYNMTAKPIPVLVPPWFVMVTVAVASSPDEYWLLSSVSVCTTRSGNALGAIDCIANECLSPAAIATALLKLEVWTGL